MAIAHSRARWYARVLAPMQPLWDVLVAMWSLFQCRRISWTIPPARTWWCGRVATWRYGARRQEHPSRRSHGVAKRAARSACRTGRVRIFILLLLPLPLPLLLLLLPPYAPLHWPPIVAYSIFARWIPVATPDRVALLSLRPPFAFPFNPLAVVVSRCFAYIERNPAARGLRRPTPKLFLALALKQSDRKLAVSFRADWARRLLCARIVSLNEFWWTALNRYGCAFC